MKRIIISVVLILVLSASLAAQSDSVSRTTSFLEGIRASILKNLGRPYAWGASGLKSFDCSGFIWRVMYDNGVLLKRTTARKFYMILPAASKEDQGKFGTLVFFDDLKHVGMIDSPEFFYHAQVSIGTNHSPMNSFWRQKIYGFRRLPAPDAPPAQ
jgi:cell wall-associated NlpC family hydrolase